MASSYPFRRTDVLPRHDHARPLARALSNRAGRTADVEVPEHLADLRSKLPAWRHVRVIENLHPVDPDAQNPVCIGQRGVDVSGAERVALDVLLDAVLATGLECEIGNNVRENGHHDLRMVALLPLGTVVVPPEAGRAIRPAEDGRVKPALPTPRSRGISAIGDDVLVALQARELRAVLLVHVLGPVILEQQDVPQVKLVPAFTAHAPRTLVGPAITRSRCQKV